MQSKMFAVAAVFSMGALALTPLAHADTLAQLSDLSTYTVYDPGNYTRVSGNVASFGAVGQEGSLTARLTDVVGGIVTLTFDLYSDGGTPNNFMASVDGLTLFSDSNIPFQNYTLETISFLATGHDTISFLGRDDPGYVRLDNVSATEASAVTPEPASIALLGTGLLGLAGAMKRRFV